MLGATTLSVQRTVGAYVDGRWVADAGAADTIVGTVQPAKKPDYDMLAAQLQGMRMPSMIRIYTTDVLAVAGNGGAGDTVSWNGDAYRVIGRSPWTSGGALNHTRYLAVRDADSGVAA